jgi:hypothetical protein
MAVTCSIAIFVEGNIQVPVKEKFSGRVLYRDTISGRF